MLLARIIIASDAYLVGLTAVIGWVTYPSFALVGPEQWVHFHQHHSRKISLAVGPAWLIQGVAANWWLWPHLHSVAAWLHALAVLGGVITTVVGAVPQHEALSREPSASRQASLRSWHAARSLCWLVALGVAIAAA